MSSIRIPTFDSIRPGDVSVKYRDVHMDIQKDDNQTMNNLFKVQTSSDIKASVDEQAIYNSINNLFNTSPGEKILEPEFGLDLRSFLFEPLTDYMAGVVGEKILKGITRWEPRVKVTNVHVKKDIPNRAYNIVLTIVLPKLSNKVVNFAGTITQQQFITT